MTILQKKGGGNKMVSWFDFPSVTDVTRGWGKKWNILLLALNFYFFKLYSGLE